MKTYRDRLRARVCSGVVLAFCLVAGGSAALAQAPSAAPGPGLSSGLPTAPIGRMRLSFSVVPAPLGSIEADASGFQFGGDAAFAFGLRPAFDYSINDYFFIGFSPQLLLNVKGEDYDDAGKELDLLVRLGGHAPVADNLHLYGYLAPGYSIIYLPSRPVNIEDPAGFVLGVAAGAIYSFSDRLFAVGDIGYQLGFQGTTILNTDVDIRSRYLLIGLGVGMKL